MQFEISMDIAAAPETVWAVLTGVERWPQWIASTTRVQRLDDGPFKVGSGGTTVTLSIAQHGWLAPLAGLLTSSLTRRYGGIKARGLKRRCEQR